MTQSPQTVTPVSPGSESRPRRPGRVRAALRRIATPSLLIGVGLVVLTSLFGIIGPFFVADPLAISSGGMQPPSAEHWLGTTQTGQDRSQEHTSELQSRGHLVCRILLEKKKTRSFEKA